MLKVKTTTDADVIAGYLCDASNTTGHASCLALPKTTAEVAAVLAHCQSKAIPLTVTAQRTSTTGGPVPNGGWLLSMEGLNTVFGPDDVSAGVILGEHQTKLAFDGLMFPPDPTSRHECTIGAAIACNASGARSFRYGPTRPWINALEVVLPTGEIMWADRDTPIPEHWPTAMWEEPKVKTAAGYYPATNLLDLMIGHEGTLGVITRARLNLVQAPKNILGLIIFFKGDEDCLAFVSTVRQGAQRPGLPATDNALNPAAIEYFDVHALAMAKSRIPDIPDSAKAALFIEIEHEGEAPISTWWDAISSATSLADDTIVADDTSSRAHIAAVRHAIPAGVNEAVVANGMPKVGTDFAVPDQALATMMAAYADVDLPSVCFGHIGDNHLHLNLLPTTAAELSTAKALYIKLATQAVALGGTVSAEHGIGKIKRALLADMVGPDTLSAFRDLKRHIDPNWILGRGTMMDVPEQFRL
jgi:FAD/FMN-containing dehydrogenase